MQLSAYAERSLAVPVLPRNANRPAAAGGQLRPERP
jgi:hypothetical protein